MRNKSGPLGGRPKTAPEGLLKFLDACERGHGGIQAGLAHFNRIDDRKRGLVLQRLRSTVPELRLVVESIQNGRSIALACTAVDTKRRGPAVGEARAGSWQVAHATVPSADKRPSKKSFWPRAIFSGVCGLSGGITVRVSSAGTPTC